MALVRRWEPRAESAFDPQRPNVSPHRGPLDRVVFVWRLYRRTRIQPAEVTGSGVIAEARRAIARVREQLARVAAPLTELRTLVFEYRMPLLVQQYQIRRDARTVLQYTLASHYVDYAPKAIGAAHIRLAGVTYAEPVLVNGVPMDGNAALKTLVSLIEAFLAPHDGALEDYELYLIDLNALASAEDPIGESEWKVVPASAVELGITAETPLQWRFGVQLWGLESNRDRAKADDALIALLDTALVQSVLAKLPALADLIETLRQGVGFMQDVEALVRDVVSVVTAARQFVDGIGQSLRAAVGIARSLVVRVSQAIASVEDALRSIRGLASLPESEVRRLVASWPDIAKPTGARTLRRIADSLYRVRDVALAVSAVGRARDSAYQTVQFVGLDDRNRTGTAPAASVGTQRIEARLRPSRERALLQDSLSALLALGSDDPWVQEQIERVQTRLAALVGEQDRSSSLYLGDAYRVIRSAGLPGSVLPADAEIVAGQEQRLQRKVTLEDHLLGVDLAHDFDRRDLVWVDGDLVLEGGLVSMLATLQRYFVVPVGTLAYAPAVGSYAKEAIGEWSGGTALSLLLLAAQRTLEQDPRVRRVRRLRVDTTNGRVVLSYDAELIDGREQRQLSTMVVANV